MPSRAAIGRVLRFLGKEGIGELLRELVLAAWSRVAGWSAPAAVGGVVAAIGSVLMDVFVALVLGVGVGALVLTAQIVVRRRAREEWTPLLPDRAEEPAPAEPTPASAEEAPPPPPRDEPLVILCRAYSLPAYARLREFIAEVAGQCYERGEWHGLAARLLMDGVVIPADTLVDHLEACLEGTREAPLMDDLAALVAAYDTLMGFAYQIGSRDVPPNQRILAGWETRDRAFLAMLSDLAASRDELAPLVRPVETRQLLRGLLHEVAS